MISAELVKSYESVFDINQKSIELFGFGKKKESKQEAVPNMTIEEVRKLPKYNEELFMRCAKLFINAWNWKAYKLPKSLGKGDDGEEADPNYEGFYDKIQPMDKEHQLTYKEKISDGKLVIYSEGIYDFAYGQPTTFKTYYKVMDDIVKRWNKRLKEKEIVVESVLEQYPNTLVYAYCDTGDGDEGCVYSSYNIEIPINSLK